VDDRRELGDRGEHLAGLQYERRGYRVLARNWRCRLGELDLVLERDGLIVICEVKTRRGAGFGGGWEAVGRRKQAKIRAVSEAFLLARGREAASLPVEGPVRFDVASVLLARDGGGGDASAQIEIFEDAF
jgi:putative endonuclease